MACISVAKSVAASDIESFSVSAYETAGSSGIGYSTASSSPESADVAAGAEDHHDHHRNPPRLIHETLTPPANTVYTPSDRRYTTWTYPTALSTSGAYYTPAYAATQTGSRTVTWSPPEVETDDVKPTSFALVSPTSECDGIYCTDRYKIMIFQVLPWVN